MMKRKNFFTKIISALLGLTLGVSLCACANTPQNGEEMLGNEQGENMKRKIIIDTDIGDDIDDAFAIALAAVGEEAELVGVTTVFRNTAARAQLVRRLLRAADKDGVEVYAGERFPLKEPFHLFDKDATDIPPETATPCQWESAYQKYSVTEGAVDYLIRAAEEYAENLTIVPIGPLTNLARAIGRAPESMKKVGRIVCMGGSFREYASEWNVLCDPEAADIVYKSGIPFYAVGLDVTMQCPLETDLLKRFEESEKPVNKLLTRWLSRWFDFFSFEKSVMHDPLAVVGCVSDVCTYEKRFVKADLEGTRGAVFVSETEREGYAPVYVATQVDREAFYREVKDRLL